MKQSVIFIILLFSLPTAMKSCDCIPTSRKFVENVSKRHLVLHAKVVKQIPYTNEYHKMGRIYGITKLSIIHSFKGKLWTDTLVHINTSPSLCGVSIQHLKQHQEVFLKAYLIDEFSIYHEYFDDGSGDFEIDKLIDSVCQQYQNIQIYSCDRAILPITKNKVSTQDSVERWTKYQQLEKCNAKKAKRYYDRYMRKRGVAGGVPVQKLYAIIENRIRARR